MSEGDFLLLNLLETAPPKQTTKFFHLWHPFQNLLLPSPSMPYLRGKKTHPLSLFLGGRHFQVIHSFEPVHWMCPLKVFCWLCFFFFFMGDDIRCTFQFPLQSGMSHLGHFFLLCYVPPTLLPTFFRLCSLNKSIYTFKRKKKKEGGERKCLTLCSLLQLLSSLKVESQRHSFCRITMCFFFFTLFWWYLHARFFLLSVHWNAKRRNFSHICCSEEGTRWKSFEKMYKIEPFFSFS